MDYITPIKKDLNENMHKVCNIFMLIGTPHETPRYFNFGGLEDDVLTIASTQKRALNFKIKTNFKFIEVQEFWQQFKTYRTEFLLTNYPTINAY